MNWQWQWFNDRQWVDYAPEVNKEIEEAFNNGEKVKEIDSERYIEFKTFLQRRIDDCNKRRKVQRIQKSSLNMKDEKKENEEDDDLFVPKRIPPKTQFKTTSSNMFTNILNTKNNNNNNNSMNKLNNHKMNDTYKLINKNISMKNQINANENDTQIIDDYDETQLVNNDENEEMMKQTVSNTKNSYAKQHQKSNFSYLGNTNFNSKIKKNTSKNDLQLKSQNIPIESTNTIKLLSQSNTPHLSEDDLLIGRKSKTQSKNDVTKRIIVTKENFLQTIVIPKQNKSSNDIFPMKQQSSFQLPTITEDIWIDDDLTDEMNDKQLKKTLKLKTKSSMDSIRIDDEMENKNDNEPIKISKDNFLHTITISKNSKPKQIIKHNSITVDIDTFDNDDDDFQMIQQPKKKSTFFTSFGTKNRIISKNTLLEMKDDKDKEIKQTKQSSTDNLNNLNNNNKNNYQSKDDVDDVFDDDDLLEIMNGLDEQIQKDKTKQQKKSSQLFPHKSNQYLLHNQFQSTSDMTKFSVFNPIQLKQQQQQKTNKKLFEGEIMTFIGNVDKDIMKKCENEGAETYTTLNSLTTLIIKCSDDFDKELLMKAMTKNIDIVHIGWVRRCLIEKDVIDKSDYMYGKDELNEKRKRPHKSNL